MSSPGEIVPELAALLREIADRIDANASDPADSEALRRLARQAAGEDKRAKLKVHFGRGQAPHGAAGVNRRLAIARAIRAHKTEHGCSLDETYRALCGSFGHGSSPGSLKNI